MPVAITVAMGHRRGSEVLFAADGFVGSGFIQTFQRLKRVFEIQSAAVFCIFRFVLPGRLAKQIDDGQDADGIEDGDADEPCELFVARPFEFRQFTPRRCSLP